MASLVLLVLLASACTSTAIVEISAPSATSEPDPSVSAVEAATPTGEAEHAGQEDVEAIAPTPASEPEPSELEPSEQAPSEPVPEVVDEHELTAVQTLVVTSPIPRGTSTTEIVAAPTVYLEMRLIPKAFVADDALESIARLRDLPGMVLVEDLESGTQLRLQHFRDPSTFTADG